MSKREKRPAAPPGSTAAHSDPGLDAMLDQPETRMVLAAVALHGMLAGKTPTITIGSDLNQDPRTTDRAAALADDAVAIADAMINRLSVPR